MAIYGVYEKKVEKKVEARWQKVIPGIYNKKNMYIHNKDSYWVLVKKFYIEINI